MHTPDLTRTILAILLICASTLPGATSKLSRNLKNLPSNTTLDVIVQFAAAPSRSALSSVTVPGGKMKRQLGRIKSALYTLPDPAISALNNNTNVEYATPGRKLKGRVEFADPATNANIACTNKS